MFQGRPNIPSVLPLRTPRTSSLWGIIHEHFGSRWNHWCCIKCILTIKVIVIRESRIQSWCSRHLESIIALREKMIPQVHRKRSISWTEYSYEMVIPSTNGTFSSISSMYVWRNQLVSYPFNVEVGRNTKWSFIVKNVQKSVLSLIMKLIMKSCSNTKLLGSRFWS